MKHYALLTLVLLSVNFISCSGNKKEKKEDTELTGITTHFADFPERQFESLYLLQNKEEAEEQLVSLGYEKLEEQPNHFKNTNENVEVLLSGNEKVSEMRIFFLSEDDITEKNRLKKLLQIAAIEENTSPEFSYFKYKTKKLTFAVNYFVQSDMLRLNIELIKPN